ncbi:hypothetical protein [Sphingopyxis sp. 113P3]|uniref:hypothetical protein n=1 Tax=Sphingopyxis sp. (strain 113P3) TaxID=292913 RepID=UPI0006AD2345|nr:hypothetical protein [Sphingopyxis sp. 113P3]
MIDKLRASDIRAALKKKFCAPEYALFFEVGDATGGRARRWADAVAMGLWPSRGLSLSGFEIKVARNDWVKEMRAPAKAEAIARYCSQWWMVTSPGIIREGELPELWGHFELHPNGLRVIKPAPLTEAEPITREFLAALLRRASELDRKIEHEAIEKAIARDAEATKRQIENEVAWRTRRGEERAKEAEQKLQAIYDACGLEPSEVTRMFGADNFARAVAMVHRLGVAQTYNGLADLAKKVRPLADSIDTFMAAISDNEEAA